MGDVTRAADSALPGIGRHEDERVRNKEDALSPMSDTHQASFVLWHWIRKLGRGEYDGHVSVTYDRARRCVVRTRALLGNAGADTLYDVCGCGVPTEGRLNRDSHHSVCSKKGTILLYVANQGQDGP